MAEIENGKVTPKIVRRGISNKTQAVSNLKFHERDAAKNGLFVAGLQNVSVEWSKNGETKTFPGLSIPRLVFHFTSLHTNASEQRHVYQTLFPVESNIDTIPEGKFAWQVDSMFRWIKHILDVFYLKGRELTEDEEMNLQLPFVDYNEDYTYEPVEPEEVVKGYQVLFENVVAMLNGKDNKPCYKTADGKPIKCWIKLLRCKKVKGEWKNVITNGNNTGDLGFDQFVGSGAVEILEPNTPPKILQLDLAKESITPKEVNKAPNIGTPQTPMMGNVAPAFNTFNQSSAYTEAGVGEDGMPF